MKLYQDIFHIAGLYVDKYKSVTQRTVKLPQASPITLPILI